MTKFIATCLLLLAPLLAACSVAPSQASTPQPCNAPNDLPRSRLLIFGEMHGTSETPALVAETVCALSAAGRSVVVGLEIPSQEQSRLNKYIASHGSMLDKRNLLNGVFWQREVQDGRSSVAMFNLIERIRELKSSGGDIRVIAIDSLDPSRSRDISMATAVRREFSTRQDATVVVLIGNYHAGKLERDSAAAELQSAAFLLTDLSPTTVLVAYGSGTAWVCMGGTCGVHPLSSKWGVTRPQGYYGGASPLAGFDGTFLLETITASPPARDTWNDG